MASTNDAPNESSLSDLNPALANKRGAGKACLSCRSRKVRCDVSYRGQPCTNCFLDSKTCLVVGRSSRMYATPLLLFILCTAVASLTSSPVADEERPRRTGLGTLRHSHKFRPRTAVLPMPVPSHRRLIGWKMLRHRQSKQRNHRHRARSKHCPSPVRMWRAWKIEPSVPYTRL